MVLFGLLLLEINLMPFACSYQMIKLGNSFLSHKYEQSIEKFNLIFVFCFLFLDFDSR